MTNESLFVLRTFWNTFLRLDGQGQLFHAHHGREEELPTVFSIEDGRLVAYNPDGGRMDEGMHGLHLHPHGSHLALYRDAANGYVSAELYGRATASRERVQQWERFEALPLSRFHMESMTDLPHRTTRWRAEPKIPRTIHQIYFGAPLPYAFGALIADLKARNPDHDHVLWTDEVATDFIRDHYGLDMLRQFERIDANYGAARADFFRYLCIYRLGGVYLDAKSTITKPISDVVPEDAGYILANWKDGCNFGRHAALSHLPRGEFQQWHVIGAAGHPFLEAVLNRVLANIARYDLRWHGAGTRGVLRLTGPIAYTLAIEPLLSESPHKLVDCEDVGLVYRAVQQPPSDRPHYSKLRIPVVSRSGKETATINGG